MSAGEPFPIKRVAIGLGVALAICIVAGLALDPSTAQFIFKFVGLAILLSAGLLAFWIKDPG